MSKLKTWFQKAVTSLVDPERESRIEALVVAIENGIHFQGAHFSLRPTIQHLEYQYSDLAAATSRIYRAALERGWSDGHLDAAEKNTAKWLAIRLEILPDQSRQLDLEQARYHFGIALSRAMQDGVIDRDEETRLHAIASAMGCDAPTFARQFFQTEGEAFLRSLFLSCVADNHFSQDDWDRLLRAAGQFGISKPEMLIAIQNQARSFVEHVLADAKSDGRISDLEWATLHWLLEQLALSADFRKYVIGEVGAIRLLNDIEDGRLPSVEMPAGMERRSGEIVHWTGGVVWREFRARGGELKGNDRPGVLVLTDDRLIFAGGAKSQSSSYRKIVAHRGTATWMELQFEGKPVYQYWLEKPSQFPYAILRSAVQLANQTKIAKNEGGNSRHIPRDVRQRVWQRYGGKCAECGATAYLEFDHIIPVARGGGNTDANVQLLCRGCNLKKSDNI